MTQQLASMQNCFQGRYTAVECIKISLALASLRRDQIAISTLSAEIMHLSFDDALNYITEVNIEQVLQRNGNSQVIAAYFYFSVICNQMRYLSEAFEQNHYPFLAVVNLDELSETNQQRVTDFEQFNYLALPNESFLIALTCLKAIFLPEFNERAHWPLPENTLRIGCAHGIDVPITHTLHTYGGAQLFDAILSPTGGQHLPSDYLINSIPPQLIDHKRNSVTVIPFGSPKLDKLYRLCHAEQAKKRRIVYHLSNWDMESNASKSNLLDNLRNIAIHFFEYEILFRPFPNDLERPELLEVIDACRDLKNIVLSRASSYVEDYASAAFMVTHREQTGLNFALASDCPVFCITHCLTKHPLIETDFGFKVSDLPSLIQHAHAYLNNTLTPERLLRKTNKIANRGRSLEVLLEYFDLFLAGKRHPTWRVMRLHRDNHVQKYGITEVETCLEEMRVSPFSYIPLARAAVSLYPKNATILLLCAQAYAKTPQPGSQPFYYYYWYRSLNLLAQAIANINTAKQRRNLIAWISSVAWQMSYELEQYLSEPRYFGDDFNKVLEVISDFKQAEKIPDMKISNPPEYAIDDTVLRKISQASGKTNTVNIFGASELAESLIAVNTHNRTISINAIYDSNPDKKGLLMNNIEVTSISESSNSEFPFLICSINHAGIMREQLRQLYGNNITIINMVEILDKRAGHL